MNETTGMDGEGQKPSKKSRQKPALENRRRTILFLRVRDGELDLFGDLADELGGMLHRRLRSDARTRAIGCNPADLEDVVQQSFLSLWEHRNRFDPMIGAIDAWAGPLPETQP